MIHPTRVGSEKMKCWLTSACLTSTPHAWGLKCANNLPLGVLFDPPHTRGVLHAMHDSAQQAAALLRTLLHASDFMLSTSYTPHAWGLKVYQNAVVVAVPIHPTRVGSENGHCFQLFIELNPPHTRGVTGGDAAQGGKIRPYAVGCQDYG